MPFKVDRAPLGIFQWLKLFGGRGPSQLEDNVRAVIDVRDNYSAPLLVASSGAPTVGALSITETLVLTGSPCRIRAISARLVVGAAAVTAGGLLEVGWSIGGVTSAQGAFNFGVAAPAQVVGYGVPVDIVLMPGTTFYSRASGTAAGADHALEVIALLEVWTGAV